VIVDENDRSSENIHAQVEGRITTRWSNPGIQPDLPRLDVLSKLKAGCSAQTLGSKYR